MTLISHAHSDIYYPGSLETRILAGFANGLSVVCDIVIAGSLTYYLHYKRTGFKRYVQGVPLGELLDMLIRFSACIEPIR